MAKDKFSRTKACATKTLYAVMKEMSRRGGSMPAKELYPFVNENVELTEWEREPAGKMQYIRWTNSFQFYSIDYQKAGFIVKKNGNWYLTPEGEVALKNKVSFCWNYQYYFVSLPSLTYRAMKKRNHRFIPATSERLVNTSGSGAKQHVTPVLSSRYPRTLVALPWGCRLVALSLRLSSS